MALINPILHPIYIYVVQHRLVKLDTIKKLSLLLLSKHNKNHKHKTHE